MVEDLVRLAMPVFAFLVMTVIGWSLLVALPRTHRDVVAAGAPALGVLLAVVVLHAFTLVIGMALGGWLMLAGAVVVLGVVAARHPHRLIISRTAIGRLVVGTSLGLLPLLVGLQPSFRVDDANIVHPNENHDAFWYVSLASWLEHHPGVDTPVIGGQPGVSSESPAYQPAFSAIDGDFRLGESLIHASLSTIVQRPISNDWYELTAGWLAFMPGAAIVLAEVLRSRWWWGALAGTTASLASFSGFQTYNQNSASLAAIATLPLVIAVVRLAAIERERRPLLFVSAVALAGFVGLYSELMSVVGLTLVLCTLLGVPGTIVARVRRAATIVAISCLLCPLAYANAVRLWSSLSSFVSAWERRAFTNGWSLAVARAVGTSSINENSGTHVLTIVLLLVLVGGLVAAAMQPELRSISVGIPLSTAAFVFLQVRRSDNYSIERLVMVSQPLLILVAVFGLCGLADVLERRGHHVDEGLAASDTRVRRRGVSLAAMSVLCLFINGVEVRTTVRALWPASVLDGRSIRPEVHQAIEWIRELSASDDGASTSVLTDDYIDRLWLADGLRDESRVSYPFLTPDYFGVPNFTANELTRYVLISREVLTDVPPSAVIRENDRYVLVDTDGIDAWFMMALGGFGLPEPIDGGTARMWMGDTGSFVVLRTSSAVAVELTMEPNPRLDDESIEVVALDQSVVGTIVADAASFRVELPLPPDEITQVRLRSNQPATAPTDTDPRLVTVSVIAPIASGL